MPTLAPCPDCNRHVRSEDSICPFCQAQLEHLQPPPSAARQFSRAAILAGTLATATACTGGDGDRVDASQVVSDAGPTADADPNQPDAFPQMPYGAPPARHRLV